MYMYVNRVWLYAIIVATAYVNRLHAMDNTASINTIKATYVYIQASTDFRKFINSTSSSPHRM